jgi:hypothetical protein
MTCGPRCLNGELDAAGGDEVPVDVERGQRPHAIPRVIANDSSGLGIQMDIEMVSW